METKDIRSLHVTKDFPVTVDELYKTWVTPDDLKKWWTPMGNHLKEVNIDLRQGGDFIYVFENNTNEHAFKITGQYEEVQENKKLVYSWNWEIPNEPIGNSQFKLTIEFAQQGAESRLIITQDNFKDEKSLQPHQEGWDKALNDLHHYVSSKEVLL